LAQSADIKVCVDSMEGVRQLQKFRSEDVKSLKVLIEINTGMNRCGVDNHQQVAELMELISAADNLSFHGFMSHSGNIYGAENIRELHDIAIDEARHMHAVAKYWRNRGVTVNTVSVGSTPASKYLNEISGIDEFRPGNYVFNDFIQVCLGVAEIEDCALSIISTVISKPSAGRVIIDAGSKSLGLDKGAHSKQITNSFGFVKEHPGAIIERLSEEHGILRVKDSNEFMIGEKLIIIPNHACAVTNLFDEALIIKDTQVVDEWKITARGKVK